MPPHAQRLMARLGVRVIFDEDAPERCPCGCWKAGNDRSITVRRPGAE
jgi:hypothetical protein